ncbi:MAG: urease accessory protein UreD [Pseudomonadota bacterium]
MKERVARVVDDSPEVNSADIDAHSRWSAHLHLNFALRFGSTALVGRSHKGPLRVQKPFFPEDGACHVYLLHPPGGLAGQDQLDMDIDVAAGAKVLLTTPASSKVYRSAGQQTQITQHLRVASGGSLDWLPQDTILFGGSRYHQTTQIHLAVDSRFLGWDIFSLGRPSSDDHYAQGQFGQLLEVSIDRRLQLRERLAFSAEDEMLNAAWGLQGYRALGILLAHPATQIEVEKLRDHIDRAWKGVGVTLLDELLVVRALGPSANYVQACLTELWCLLRPRVAHMQPVLPRVWAT